MSALDNFLIAAIPVGIIFALMVPDPQLSEDMCRPGYAAAHRLPPEQYYPLAKRVFAEHGIAWSERAGYQLDHRLPLCLGGSNDPGNLTPQPLAEARLKDDLEAYACREVCAGHVPLKTARGWFEDWKSAYREILR